MVSSARGTLLPPSVLRGQPGCKQWGMAWRHDLRVTWWLVRAGWLGTEPALSGSCPLLWAWEDREEPASQSVPEPRTQARHASLEGGTRDSQAVLCHRMDGLLRPATEAHDKDKDEKDPEVLGAESTCAKASSWGPPGALEG